MESQPICLVVSFFAFSSMRIPTVKGKERDVLLQNVSVSLDNGTVLLDGVDLKYAYQRRYAIVGENGGYNILYIIVFLNAE